MIEIIPAIIPKSFQDLQQKMSLVTGFVPLVQVDVVDGVFVPSKSWPYQKGEPHTDPDFAHIISEQTPFPFWEELDFEVDLMVSNPEAAAEQWILAGAKRLIVHLESVPGAVSDPSVAKKVFSNIKKSLPTKDSVLYIEIGVAINPETPNSALEPIMEYVDFVQFMGIAKIGFQGQPFDERVLEKVSALRAALPNVTISVDGSVNEETAPRLVDVGVNRLVIGSAIFESENIAATIEDFFAIADSDSDADADFEDKQNGSK